MLPAEDRIRVEHMLAAARETLLFARGRTREDLDSNRQLFLAIQRSIEILGEAAKKVTAETRQRSADIPWSPIGRMRDRVIHAYHDVNPDIVWATVTSNLPPLVEALESLLEADDSES